MVLPVLLERAVLAVAAMGHLAVLAALAALVHPTQAAVVVALPLLHLAGQAAQVS